MTYTPLASRLSSELRDIKGGVRDLDIDAMWVVDSRGKVHLVPGILYSYADGSAKRDKLLSFYVDSPTPELSDEQDVIRVRATKEIADRLNKPWIHVFPDDDFIAHSPNGSSEHLSGWGSFQELRLRMLDKHFPDRSTKESENNAERSGSRAHRIIEELSYVLPSVRAGAFDLLGIAEITSDSEVPLSNKTQWTRKLSRGLRVDAFAFRGSSLGSVSQLGVVRQHPFPRSDFSLIESYPDRARVNELLMDMHDDYRTRTNR